MMRRKQSGLWTAAVLTLAIGLLSAPVIAGQSPLASTSVGPHGINWLASGQYEKIVLTVTGPEGLVLRREFARGESPSFDAIGTDGKPLVDGTYNFELVASPFIDRATRRALANARQAQDDSIVQKLRAEGKLPSEPMVQSGAFRVAGGSIVQQDGQEETEGNAQQTKAAPKPVATEDQVIPDDLIVQGSACVGLDCVNNENFGFDTIRLKENNLRIHFDDTSTQAGFPANDWRLIANDSASGGSSKFSIEDSTSAKTPFTITAGASTNSIFVDSTGRVGLRTSTPVLDLHINTSNTPAIRLEQNNTGGFTAQTWDIGANEANFFVRDVTSGSLLSFRIRPGAPTSSIDISSDGDVGIGTASPSQKLDVASGKIAIGDHTIGERTLNGSFPEDLEVRALRNTIYDVDSDNNSTNAGFVVVRNGDATQVIFVAREDNLTGINRSTPSFPLHVGTDATNGNGAHVTTAGVWTNGSSRTNKTNIQAISSQEAFAALEELEPVRYVGKNDPSNEEYMGFIAEDVPELVAQNDRASLSSMDIVAVLTKVVKDQEKTINDLAARLAELEARNAKP
jgi:hypothetical protein